MTREHTLRPGITWDPTVIRVETVVPDDTPDPRPNRATRRALRRAKRKASR
ncbi:hypothetical protein AB0D10_05435 [Kitasatospora sp. NPDC048545]|uniref:hypothetical protein n=1 Tax=Kitasatospora sp. NPDC048545 TaxID=3157208 RepID=UPI00340B440C